MHILIGAAVGAVFAVGITLVAAVVMKKKITAKSVLIAAVGGAVAGGVGAATLGTSSLIGTTLVRQATSFAAGGAAGGAAERVTSNALEGRPLEEHLVESTAIGAGAGLVSLGTLKGSRAIISKVAPALAPSATTTGLRRLLMAPVPGTGGGLITAIETPAAVSLAPTLHSTERRDRDQTVSVPADNTAVHQRAPPPSGTRGLRGLLDK